MNLFNQIPSNFFSILSGSLKEVHIQLLGLVYENYKKTINVIEKEVVIDLFVDYLEQYDDESDYDNNVDFIRNKRERAHQYLNKFFEHGWLRQEQYVDYKYRVSIPDYAVKILDTFEKIASGYQLEFSGTVMSIYSNLANEENESFYGVQQAFENTLELINGLKELNHNIKQYTENLLEQENAKEILVQLFDNYGEQVLGKHYYRLKTSDNIAKYRIKIINKAREYRHSNEIIKTQAERMVQLGFVRDVIDGENQLYDWLEAIENAFINIFDFLTEIDDKNRKYHRAAFAQVNFHLNKGKSFTSIINNLLLQISTTIRSDNSFALKYLEEGLDEFLQIYTQSYIDETSFKFKSKKRPPVKQNPEPPRVINPEMVSKNLNQFKQTLKNEMTIQKVNKYVEEVLGNAKRKHLDQFPFENHEDYMQIIYTVLYSTNKKAVYKLAVDFDEKSFVQLENGVVPNVEIHMEE
ncbi:Wadjet anti-phage system protein JetA family protein [Lysinibacillus sp. FSL W7-1291]|uniref:Wadjet anti-phage system protein JetA family protein n=1 Tax=Lysinibacillus sp. FSL W7-1291 TaxID=2954544 RepID=UPI00315B1358